MIASFTVIDQLTGQPLPGMTISEDSTGQFLPIGQTNDIGFFSANVFGNILITGVGYKSLIVSLDQLTGEHEFYLQNEFVDLPGITITATKKKAVGLGLLLLTLFFFTLKK